MSPKLLILDLDETLFHACREPLAPPADFRVGEFSVYVRPGAARFLMAAAWCELAVWTSATEAYARAMMERVFPARLPVSFVWARERCTRRYDPDFGTHCWVKDLKKLRRRGYRLEGVLVVDDSPEKLERNYGNLIPVRPYLGQTGDDELPLLLDYLDSLRQVEDVRSVEKRHWRAGRKRA